MDEKRRWLVLIALLAASIVFYVSLAAVFASRVGASGGIDIPAVAPIVVAAVCLAGAATIARVAAVPHNPPARFRILSLVSLVVLEGGALIGVFMTFVARRLWPSLLLCGAALAAVALFVVPAGNAWFRAREAPPDAASPLGPS